MPRCTDAPIIRPGGFLSLLSAEAHKGPPVLVLTLGSAVAVEVPHLAAGHLAGDLDQAVGPLPLLLFLPWEYLLLGMVDIAHPNGV